MKVIVWVRDQAIEIEAGPGNQRLKWLAMVAMQRYEAILGETASQVHVPNGIMNAEGTLLPPNKSIRVALVEGQEVFALVQEDEDETARGGIKGTSKFVMTQGAAPSMCLIEGPGIGYATEGEATFFFLTARDTYSNLTRNGGEFFNVTIREMGDKLGLSKQQQAHPPSAEEIEAATPKASVGDFENGAYVINTVFPKKGKYQVSVDLDGEPILESPFNMCVIKTKVPPVIKWLSPGDMSGKLPKFESAVSVCMRRQILIFGGHDGKEYGNALTLFTTDRSTIETLEGDGINGTAPSARAGAASCLSAHRLYIYGGVCSEEERAGLTYLSDLHYLDLDPDAAGLLTWNRSPTSGMAPGPLAYAAMAAIGSKMYVFGGKAANGEATNNLFMIGLTSMCWDLVEDQVGVAPRERYNHSMVASDRQLLVYGGRFADSPGATLRDMWIYDTVNECWSQPGTTGDPPRERWGHSSMLWGRNLVVGLGHDGDRESNVVSMLNLDTYDWDAWDGNLNRNAMAMHLVEGKLFVLGGMEDSEPCSHLHQLNMGGFMIDMDGVDDTLMIMHMPTILPTVYTMECWCRPTGPGPMNIMCRSDEGYADAVWSHQLRINSDGSKQWFEHYVHAEERFVVAYSTPLQLGNWYHVCGVATGGGEMKLFVNGKEAGQSVTIGALRGGLDRYFVGAKSGDGMKQFKGTIAEIKLWNYALTDDEVHDNRHKVCSGTERGIVGYWRIDEGPGALVFDLSQYGNTGRIKGHPEWTAHEVPLSH